MTKTTMQKLEAFSHQTNGGTELWHGCRDEQLTNLDGVDLDAYLKSNEHNVKTYMKAKELVDSVRWYHVLEAEQIFESKGRRL